MLGRLRRFLDVRAGEGLPVLLSFLYVAAVVAAFLLAKPIRNSLYLREYGPYKLVYAYAAVPLALSLFIPIYGRLAARVGSRTATTGTLVFFSFNVLAFWWAFRTYKIDLLPGIFYVWGNCFGVIAPEMAWAPAIALGAAVSFGTVQAWSFANSLFDARQARRLFGLIGAGASLCAIGGGVLQSAIVRQVGAADFYMASPKRHSQGPPASHGYLTWNEAFVLRLLPAVPPESHKGSLLTRLLRAQNDSNMSDSPRGPDAAAAVADEHHRVGS